VSELNGTTSLKLSEGFSRPIPSFGVVVGYGLAFYRQSRVSASGRDPEGEARQRD